jgi:hypothetical protein
MNNTSYIDIHNIILAMEKNSKVLAAISTAILIAIGIGGITGTFSTSAFAYGNYNNNNQIPTVVTIPLEGKSLAQGQFLLLSDITPVQVNRAHIALNIPCQDGSSNNPQSDITVVAGVAPNVKKVDLTFIKQLSSPPDNCTYHADIPQDIQGNSNAKVTDIAIISLNRNVEFGSGNFVTLAISAVH